MDSEPKKKKKGKGKKKHKKNKDGEASNSKNFFQQNAPSPGQKWEDDLFPPNDKSLIGSTPNSNDSFECTNKDIDPTEIEWKRANEIFPEPHLFEGEISTKKIVNGKNVLSHGGVEKHLCFNEKYCLDHTLPGFLSLAFHCL